MKQKTQPSRSLKRLVLRLAYCAKFDFRWYFKSPYGVRSHVDNVLSFAFRTVGSFGLLLAALAVLLVRPLVSPLHWLWHATVNAGRIEQVMAKSENEVDEWTALTPGEVERKEEREVRKWLERKTNSSRSLKRLVLRRWGVGRPKFP